jgi:demethylmenaquinone methyltransferase/2-methoxy-6-polyprenyl-1,4-benzoquinol methylase
MSSYVFMRVLESSARRYDRGIRLLSHGRIDEVYESLAVMVARPGIRILDVGCGTGGVAVACAVRGAEVVGIDRNADMLEVARSKTLPFGAKGTVEWLQLSAAEIEDRFEPSSFDAITACLVFSELSPDERAYTLAICQTRLRPGGDLVLADEVVPASAARRFLHHLGRMPIAALTYLLTQTTTRAVRGLAEAVRAAGYVDVDEQLPWADFAIVRGRRPLEAA